MERCGKDSGCGGATPDTPIYLWFSVLAGLTFAMLRVVGASLEFHGGKRAAAIGWRLQWRKGGVSATLWLPDCCWFPPEVDTNPSSILLPCQRVCNCCFHILMPFWVGRRATTRFFLPISCYFYGPPPNRIDLKWSRWCRVLPGGAGWCSVVCGVGWLPT